MSPIGSTQAGPPFTQPVVKEVFGICPCSRPRKLQNLRNFLSDTSVFCYSQQAALNDHS